MTSAIGHEDGGAGRGDPGREMSVDAAFTLGVLVLATVGLALEISSPDVLLLAAVAVLVIPLVWPL